MKKATKEEILRELGHAQNVFDDAVERIADKFRKEVIVPVCKRYRLEFVSGNGRFFFISDGGKGESLYGEDGERLQATLKPIFEVLNEEVCRTQHLGYFVSDVLVRDYE